MKRKKREKRRAMEMEERILPYYPKHLWEKLRETVKEEKISLEEFHYLFLDDEREKMDKLLPAMLEDVQSDIIKKHGFFCRAPLMDYVKRARKRHIVVGRQCASINHSIQIDRLRKPNPERIANIMANLG